MTENKKFYTEFQARKLNRADRRAIAKENKMPMLHGSRVDHKKKSEKSLMEKLGLNTKFN